MRLGDAQVGDRLLCKPGHGFEAWEIEIVEKSRSGEWLKVRSYEPPSEKWHHGQRYGYIYDDGQEHQCWEIEKLG